MNLYVTLWLCGFAVLGTATFLAALSFFECLNEYRAWRRKRKGGHDGEAKG
jgi:hypothetical protein